MSDDLIKRLRGQRNWTQERERKPISAILTEAADALEAAKRENERMREALEEIATYDTGATAGLAHTATIALATDQKGGEHG